MVVGQKVALGRIQAPDRYRAGLRDHPAVELSDGDVQVIRRTTTQPVRSIKGQRPRTPTSFSRPCVAYQLADMCRTSVV